ncbi:hypothetical protein D9M68_805890 [compost metagenome]
MPLELGQRERLVFAFGLCCRNPVGDFGRGGLGMIHAGQVRHGLGPLFAAADRHMGGFVRPQYRQRMLQRFELAAESIEFLEGHRGLRE